MKKHSSNLKKFITSSLMLALSASMLASSTYAWFTINKEVELTNINLQVKTSSNLLISETNQDDSTFHTKLTESKYALLEPTSTIDGITYFYTLDGAADGHKYHGPDEDNPYEVYNENKTLTVEDTYADKIKFDETFNEAYGISTANPTSTTAFKTAYGYVDYTFYLKAISTAASQKLVINKCNLLYEGEPVEEKAWRVAVFYQETEAGTEPTSIGDLVTIIGIENAENQTSGKAVNSEITVGNVENYGTAAQVDEMNENEVKYYKVVLRCWIEGEDTTCTTEMFSTKTENYSLKFDFTIEDDAEAITFISSEEE